MILKHILHMKEILIITFDIPINKSALRTRIWRELRKIGAENRFRSHWTLPFSEGNLVDLKVLRDEIMKSGGKAEVIRGVIVG